MSGKAWLSFTLILCLALFLVSFMSHNSLVPTDDGLPVHLEPNDGVSELDPVVFYLDMAEIALKHGDAERFRYWIKAALDVSRPAK